MDPSSFFNYAIPIKKSVLSLGYLDLHGKSMCERKPCGTKIVSVGTVCMFMLYGTQCVLGAFLDKSG